MKKLFSAALCLGFLFYGCQKNETKELLQNQVPMLEEEVMEQVRFLTDRGWEVRIVEELDENSFFVPFEQLQELFDNSLGTRTLPPYLAEYGEIDANLSYSGSKTYLNFNLPHFFNNLSVRIRFNGTPYPVPSTLVPDDISPKGTILGPYSGEISSSKFKISVPFELLMTTDVNGKKVEFGMKMGVTADQRFPAGISYGVTETKIVLHF